MRERISILLFDGAGVACLAIVSLIAALAVNARRTNPLPLRYRSPEQRLAASLTSLVAAPAFRLADFTPVGLDEFRKIVTAKSAVVLDARAKPFYEDGHVPGALNLARDDFAHDYLKLRGTLEAAKDKPVVIYCSGGECHDSQLVASALASLGFTNVRIFTGGWPAWSEAGGAAAH